MFVDTAALIALLNQVDELHRRAVSIQLELTRSGTPLVTSEWVLAEFLNAMARPPLRARASRVVDRLRNSARTEVVGTVSPAWHETHAFYEGHQDKAWSFVDCSSKLICRVRGITRVFTHDRDFEQFGLECLLRT